MYVHKTVKEILDTKMNEMREFPNRMRQYQIYETYIDHIKNYKKVNEIFQELIFQWLKFSDSLEDKETHYDHVNFMHLMSTYHSYIHR